MTKQEIIDKSLKIVDIAFKDDKNASAITALAVNEAISNVMAEVKQKINAVTARFNESSDGNVGLIKMLVVNNFSSAILKELVINE